MLFNITGIITVILHSSAGKEIICSEKIIIAITDLITAVQTMPSPLQDHQRKKNY